MKNKGFTLIELLAVILILGIIALIAIPIIGSVINDAKYGSFKASMTNIVDIVANMCEVDRLKGNDPSKNYIFQDGISDKNIEAKGLMPQRGVINVDDECNISAYLSNDKYSINKPKDDDRFSEIDNEVIDKIMKSYEDGTPVYFNPTEGVMCTEDEVITGPETINGCMRWYIFNDEVGNDRVNMILEHNVYKVYSYPKSLEKLENMGWAEGLNPRMLSLDELSKITNNNLYDYGSQLEDGYSIYTWLYNYTKASDGEVCTQIGCKYYNSNSSYYWLNTKTPNYDTTNRIYVVAAGKIILRVERDGAVGLRPVISIPKTLFNN